MIGVIGLVRDLTGCCGQCICCHQNTTSSDQKRVDSEAQFKCSAPSMKQLATVWRSSWFKNNKHKSKVSDLWKKMARLFVKYKSSFHSTASRTKQACPPNLKDTWHKWMTLTEKKEESCGNAYYWLFAKIELEIVMNYINARNRLKSSKLQWQPQS